MTKEVTSEEASRLLREAGVPHLLDEDGRIAINVGGGGRPMADEQQEERTERVKLTRQWLALHPDRSTSAQTALEDLCLLLVDEGRELDDVLETAANTLKQDFGIGDDED